MRLGRTTVVYFASQVGLSVAGFVATWVIARELGAATLGTYAVVLALLFWLTVPANAVGNAITKRISEGTAPGEHLSAGLAMNAGIALAAVLGVVAFGGWVDAYVGWPASDVLAVLVLGDVAFLTIRQVLKGEKRVAYAGMLQGGERVLRTAAQVGLILLGYRLSGVLAGHVASLLVATALGLLFFGSRPSLPDREHLRDILSFAQYSWLGTLQTQVFAWMDTIILGFFVAKSLIGIYEVAWSLASVLGLMAVSIKQTLFPELSSLSSDDDYERLHHVLNEGIAFTGVFAIPGLFGAAVLGDRLLRIYSPEFARGETVFLVLIVARIAAMYGNQLVNAINGVDRPDVAFRINLGFVAANLGLNLVLVYYFGWYGAAIATALSAGLMLGLGYRALASLVGRPRIPYREIGSETAAAVVMAAVLVGIVPRLPKNDYVTIATVLFGAGVYGAVLLSISERTRGKVRMLLDQVLA